jgi:hypothetical protein
VELFEQIRREYEHGGGTIRGIAKKLGIHRRMVREAVLSAVPVERKTPVRERPKLEPTKAFVEAILEADRQAPRKQRHTAHRIWCRIRAEMPGVRIGESTIRHYVRERKIELRLVSQEVFIPQSYSCQKIARYGDTYRTKKSLEPLIAELLHSVNIGRVEPEPQTIQHFVESIYLPYVRQHKRPSTAKGYTDIYEDHVKTRVAGVRLGSFRTVDGQRLLDNIAANGKLSHQTLIHIKSFLSGVFSHALRTGAIDGANPIHGKGTIVIPDGTPTVPTHAYTLPEIETLISALPDGMARIAVIVAAFTGLSLSELRGLQWADIEDDQIIVRRSYWRQHEGNTKTPARSAPVPLLPVVSRALRRHHKGNPASVVSEK